MAVKMHFGEDGATGYIHPSYPCILGKLLKARRAKPFLTDTNTLYHGFRANGVDHHELAIRNGFAFDVVGMPVVIADGIRSHSVREIPAGPRHFKTVKVGGAIWEAENLITLNHFKGHLLTGFGGAIKNLSMGCGSRATKQRMHADLKPEIKVESCIGCGECVAVCPVGAIHLEEGRVEFDHGTCIGCAECLSACLYGAIRTQWSGSSRTVQEKMAEVALAVLSLFPNPVLHFNFLLNITPECDCLKWTDNPIVQNIGILASTDPVAVDQAGLDLVTESTGLPDSALPDGAGEGMEKFQLVHSQADPSVQLEYGETIGLGSRDYRLIEIK
ncbi:DUF362 domain-containing protein [bacterium]|nr:DUF362 domain-containing protein [candidate division CSSED10-310 bacterium]